MAWVRGHIKATPFAQGACHHCRPTGSRTFTIFEKERDIIIAECLGVSLRLLSLHLSVLVCYTCSSYTINLYLRHLFTAKWLSLQVVRVYYATPQVDN